MAPTRTRLAALAAGLTAALMLVPAGTGAAGGWAVSTLDPLPQMQPGAVVDVGFTIRQHGVRPVDVDEMAPKGKKVPPVGVAFTSSGGERELFTASEQGPPGHYVATVTVPEAGSYRWEVLQGGFGSQQLGSIEIGDALAPVAPPTQPSGDGSEWVAALRWASLGLALALGALAAFDLVARRRRAAAVAAHERA